MTNIAQIELETGGEGGAAAPDATPEAAVPTAAQFAEPAPAAPASRLPLVACAVALLAAVAGLTSVVMASRVSARAGELVERAERDEAAFDKLPALVARFEAATARAEAHPPSQAVTPADLRAELTDLRRDLGKYAAANDVGGIRASQAEIGNRIGQVIEKLNRIEEKAAH